MCSWCVARKAGGRRKCPSAAWRVSPFLSASRKRCRDAVRTLSTRHTPTPRPHTATCRRTTCGGDGILPAGVLRPPPHRQVRARQPAASLPLPTSPLHTAINCTPLHSPAPPSHRVGDFSPVQRKELLQKFYKRRRGRVWKKKVRCVPPLSRTCTWQQRCSADHLTRPPRASLPTGMPAGKPLRMAVCASRGALSRKAPPRKSSTASSKRKLPLSELGVFPRSMRRSCCEAAATHAPARTPAPPSTFQTMHVHPCAVPSAVCQPEMQCIHIQDTLS